MGLPPARAAPPGGRGGLEGAVAAQDSPFEELSRLLSESGAIRRLQALRRHIWAILMLFAAASGAGFVLSPVALEDMRRRQVTVGELVMLSPTEGFMVRVKLALVMGAAVTLPAVMLAVWWAMTRGWSRWRRFKAFLMVPVAVALFGGGAAFVYLILVPAALGFLLSFASGPLEPLLSVDSFVQFVVTAVIAGGVVFQLPVFVFFLARLGVIDHRTLASRRSYALVGSAALAAVLTPPDVFSQLLLAIPLALLYELSIWVAWLAAPRLRPARLRAASREP